MSETYRCGGCGEQKARDAFYWRKTGKQAGQRHSTCIPCGKRRSAEWYLAHPGIRAEHNKAWKAANPERVRENSRAWKAANPEKVRNQFLRKQYGITATEYDAMLAAQGNGCAICSGTHGHAPLYVDHDHATGAVRGLLCVSCNTAIGLLRDDPSLIVRASEYVRTGGKNALTDLLGGGQGAAA